MEIAEEKKQKRADAMALFESNSPAVFEDVPIEQWQYVSAPQGRRFKEMFNMYSKKGSVTKLQSFAFPTGERVYVGTILNKEEDRNDISFFLDSDGRGYALLFDGKIDDFEGTIPYVAYTFTDERFGQEGRAIRRLWLMNQYAKQKYGTGLFSNLRKTFMPQVWNVLLTKGFAKVVVDKQSEQSILQMN